MASSNNSKIISQAHPHTIKKFELIEAYIKSWAQKLMLNKSCSGIIFIDCMCNSGVYHDSKDKVVYGTPIRIANALLDVARTYLNKQVEIYLNDNNPLKIEELEKHLPQNENNYSIITSTEDGNELLKQIGQQLGNNSHKHFFLLYDPYDASIDWDALTPFFQSWGEILINHMISDSIRAIRQTKREQTKNKYIKTYQVDDISELVPYGSDKVAYEKRIREIIDKLKGSDNRRYYISAFPFFNTRNALVYDLIHCTSHEIGFKLFKSTVWKTFDGRSSAKSNNDIEGQMMLDAFCSSDVAVNFDEYCYTLTDAAQYLQSNFHGRLDVPKNEVWQLLDQHPVFISEGFTRAICENLKNYYGAKISKSTISFLDRRG